MSILIKGLNNLNIYNRLQILVSQDNKFRCREYINCVDENGGLVEAGYRDYPIEFLSEKHGRLIDADKLRNNEYFDVSPQERDLEDSVVYEIIDNAPTIIEAE